MDGVEGVKKMKCLKCHKLTTKGEVCRKCRDSFPEATEKEMNYPELGKAHGRVKK